MKGGKTPSPTTKSLGEVTRVATTLPTLRRKKRTKTKSDRGKKRIKRSTNMYCYLHGENTSHNSKDYNTIKAKCKAKPKFTKKDFKKKPGNSIS